MRRLRVAVPTGIGDCVWAMTKVPAILRHEGASAARVLFCVQGQPSIYTTRSADVLRALPFVEDVDQVSHPIHPYGRHWETDGMLYLESGRVRSSEFDYLLLPNHYVERGVRLEDWLPQFATDWDVLNGVGVGSSDEFCAGAKFVCFYLSAATYYDRSDVGFNRADAECPGRWTLADWVRLAETLLIDKLGGAYTLAVVGAEYDRPMADRFCSQLRRVSAQNLCGRTTGPQLVDLLRRASLVVGYPSGVPILATFLRRPTVMFYNGVPLHRQRRPDGSPEVMTFAAGFPTSWVPPGCDGRTYEYLRFGVHGVDDVLAAVGRFQKRGLIRGDDAGPDTHQEGHREPRRSRVIARRSR